MPGPTHLESFKKIRQVADSESGTSITLGSSSASAMSKITVFDGGAADLASEITLHDQAGNPYTLWFDQNGDFRKEAAATKSGDLAGSLV